MGAFFEACIREVQEWRDDIVCDYTFFLLLAHMHHLTNASN